METGNEYEILLAEFLQVLDTGKAEIKNREIVIRKDGCNTIIFFTEEGTCYSAFERAVNWLKWRNSEP